MHEIFYTKVLLCRYNGSKSTYRPQSYLVEHTVFEVSTRKLLSINSILPVKPGLYKYLPQLQDVVIVKRSFALLNLPPTSVATDEIKSHRLVV